VDTENNNINKTLITERDLGFFRPFKPPKFVKISTLLYKNTSALLIIRLFIKIAEFC